MHEYWAEEADCQARLVKGLVLCARDCETHCLDAELVSRGALAWWLAGGGQLGPCSCLAPRRPLRPLSLAHPMRDGDPWHASGLPARRGQCALRNRFGRGSGLE